MARDAYDTLIETPGRDDRDPLSIELVFAAPLSQAEVQARLATVLPDVEARAEAVFDENGDRFHFVTFAKIDPHGQEREVFAFARELRREMEAEEANPVLPDSLYGAVHVGTEGLFSFCETPRDSSRPFGWHHPQIKTPLAWAHTKGSGSTVAVIDTGYTGHNELHGVIEMQGQWNFVENDGDARDRFTGGFLKNPGHGTLVTSVVASRGGADMQGNTTAPGGVTGTAPEAKVLPIRAIRSVIDFNQRRIAPAIMHAVAQKADVIVMALGGPTRVASTEQALRNAVAEGTVVVCAAGNCYPAVVFPAAYAPMGICTAVAALQPDKRPWRKSGRGREVTLSAYGEHVWGAAKNKPSDPDAGIRASQGTTLATSMTGGVAALWVARHGGRATLLSKARAAGTTVQAMWVHCATHGLSQPSEWGGATNLGAGIIDARRVLETPLPTGTENPAPPDPVATSTLNVLVSHLAGQSTEAANEVTPALSEYAPEILWLSYRRGARARIAETEGGAEAVPGQDEATPGLKTELTDKPALAALVGSG
ncbi:subtilase family protein [Primorskyibacter sedentarius]|uniref:Subtilase family protein n=1 Tax=Primorskyibacter sedentarius TaxID=745311 RepID=A0A4R3JEN3_9RHOB|nr:S8 family serine peptidase [Primorskyibacter sedentarius]TCS64528.1 subtilase family protein [Primorskyibacter sedentarius]